MAVEEMKSSIVLKKIKVENWSSFLLQKLYVSYTQKKDCDFTLKMVDGNLKVHSVVMNACTNYFIQMNLENTHMLTLSPPLVKETMEPIVNFIYSGVLTFKSTIQKDLVTTCKILGIDILTKLIDTEQSITDSRPLSNKTVPFADAHIKQKHYLSSGSDNPASSTPSPLKPVLKSTPSVIKSIGNTPSTNISSPREPVTPSTGAGKMAVKKLPFWRKRTTIPSSSLIVPKIEDPEDVKPTRFELPEDSLPNSNYFYVPNFDNPLSYESECMLKSDEKILKRVTESVVESVTERKKMKLIKSVVQQEEESSQDCDEEILPDDDYEDDTFENSPATLDANSTPKPILKTDRLDSARKKSVRFSESLASGASSVAPGVLTSGGANGNGGSTSEEETVPTKVVTIKQETVEQPSEGSSDNKGITMGSDGSIHMSLNNPNALASIDPNHAKIIGEVLQKYPDLLLGNRNFKLKVVNSDNQIINYIMYNKSKQPGKKKKLAASNGIAQPPGPKSPTTPVVNSVTPATPFETRPVVKCPAVMKSFPGGGIEHTAPSSFDCKYCGITCEPLTDYRTWRLHMTRVHGEKFDVRICEYCGLKLSKRNLYLYHLLRVHDVATDAMKFPKCSFCSYIALTENLLYKHCKNTHSKVIGFMCPTCNVMFNTKALLVEHMQIKGHEPNKKQHKCQYCTKTFDRIVNLKAHYRSNHNDREVPSENAPDPPVVQAPVLVKEELMGQQEPQDSYDAYGQYIEVPVMQNANYGTLVLPGGVTIIDTNNTRMPEHSSGSIGMDSESILEGTPAMEPNEAVLGTNELGQTVLILNGNQQYILEQQADGRLVLPDILANNCVITYAEDTTQGGLESTGGDYEIINVEQAQQEVMMSGQGILVQDTARNNSAGQAIYGAHAGESILSSQESNTVPASLVLTSNAYPVLQNHMSSTPMIQTIITSNPAPALTSSVIQSTHPTTSTIHQHILNTSRVQHPVTSHALMTLSQDPLATENHSADTTLTRSEAQFQKSELDLEARELGGTTDYQDGYDSEGGMVIDAPSEQDTIGEGGMACEESSHYEETNETSDQYAEASGQYSESSEQYIEASGQYSKTSEQYTEASGKYNETSKQFTESSHQYGHYGAEENGEDPVRDDQVFPARVLSANKDNPQCSASETSDTAKVDECATPLSNAIEPTSGPESATVNPLTPLRRNLAAGAAKIQALGSAVQATVQALEDDWGENMGEEEDGDEDEDGVGPSRAEL